MQIADYVETLRASPKFLAWHPERIRCKSKDILHAYVMAEKHFTPKELAKLWGVDPETIRNIFRNEQGVLKIQNVNGKRAYCTLRIPESVATAVHRKLSA